MSDTVLNVGYPVGPADTWTKFEKRVVTIGVLSYLLEPSDSDGRNSIRLCLLADALPRLEDLAQKDPNREPLLKIITDDLKNSVTTLARERAAKDFKSDLAFDLTEEKRKHQTGNHLRHLLGMALIVHEMHHAAVRGEKIGTTAAVRREKIGTTEARGRIEVNYEGRPHPLFAINDRDLGTALTHARNVASLASALLQYISGKHLKRKMRYLYTHLWRSDIKRFLRHALYFQQFLTGARDPKHRYDMSKLVLLPEEFKLEPLKPKGKLRLPPRPDRKSAPGAARRVPKRRGENVNGSKDGA